MLKARMCTLIGLCLTVAAAPAWSQTRPDKDKRVTYFETKPQMRQDLLQTFLRRMRGGETTEVTIPPRDKPVSAHYLYSGPEFSGQYWEERIGDREPTSILGVWLTGFHEACDDGRGRYFLSGEAPVEVKGNVVHSGAWSCELKDMTLNGYFTVHKFGTAVMFFSTQSIALKPDVAKNLASQIHSDLVNLIRQQ